ncbi:MAG: hypothetical protein AABX30_03425 [Nanoarchaeota archaeon]
MSIEISTLLPICSDYSKKGLKTILDSVMFEIEVEQPPEFPVNVHIEYCQKCKEYKGYRGNFLLSQEKEAIEKQFQIIYEIMVHQIGKIKRYRRI